jgi:enoyl-CoA hydratase/3-hydroxypropionyl-coenzyme A dehydratase
LPPVTLSIERHGRVAVVAFRRAEQLNAISSAMQAEITETFEALGGDDGVGAIVVTGEGRGFMAGADIKEYASQSEPAFDDFQSRGRRMYDAIEQNPKPVIAAVNGYALGGGFELVLCCDLVVASRDAKFGLPEIKLALVPGGGGTQRSVRRFGRNRANYLLLTGGIFPAEIFEAWGLVNEVVDPVELMPRALALATEIAAAPVEATGGLKWLTQLAEASADLSPGLDRESELVRRLFRSEVAKERVRAFAEKSAARAKR